MSLSSKKNICKVQSIYAKVTLPDKKLYRKKRKKFDSLVFEMLFIKNLKPNFNIKMDSIHAKLSVWSLLFFLMV